VRLGRYANTIEDSLHTEWYVNGCLYLRTTTLLLKLKVIYIAKGFYQMYLAMYICFVSLHSRAPSAQLCTAFPAVLGCIRPEGSR
jgi:hypothetical protein